jgi:hypothetical protein
VIIVSTIGVVHLTQFVALSERRMNDSHQDRIEAWLRAAIADAERRGLPELKPLLETLARSTANLRSAEDRLAGPGPRHPER